MDGPPTDTRPVPDMAALFAERERDRYAMHESHLNEQMVRDLSEAEAVLLKLLLKKVRASLADD